MTFNTQTVALLKNFATINQGLLFTKGEKNKGTRIRTVSPESEILAEAQVQDVIPQNFAIYDLNQFLNVIGLFNSPEFTFGHDAFLKIQGGEGKSSVKYFFAHESMITVPPNDLSKVEKLISEAEINFVVSEDDWAAVTKASSVLGTKFIGVVSDGTTVQLTTLDTETESSNSFSLEVAEGNGTSYNMLFKAENLKILKGSYDVSISSQEISCFKNLDMDLKYYISLEEASSYNN
jgi:hypothetical protein